jgi:hypothetical protein
LKRKSAHIYRHKKMSYNIYLNANSNNDNQLRAIGPDDRAKAFKRLHESCDQKIGTGDRTLCHGLYNAWEADIASGGTLFRFPPPKSGWFW